MLCQSEERPDLKTMMIWQLVMQKDWVPKYQSILKIILLLPVSTADCERGFSEKDTKLLFPFACSNLSSYDELQAEWPHESTLTLQNMPFFGGRQNNEDLAPQNSLRQIYSGQKMIAGARMTQIHPLMMKTERCFSFPLPLSRNQNKN
jgi:hypothetical protein